MNMEESVKKQYAFISYSHKDIRTAKRLQRWLESYKLPTSIQNEFFDSSYLRPVVRVGSDFGAGALCHTKHVTCLICALHTRIISRQNGTCCVLPLGQFFCTTNLCVTRICSTESKM